MQDSFRFSIIIPSWNNLPFLKTCCHSIERHSKFKHQIIIHINEGNDGTLEWVSQKGYDNTFSEENIGICKAVNLAFKKATTDFIVYMNDDMYALPGWDEELWSVIQNFDHNSLMLSSTMIEPRDSGNSCVIVQDFGRTLENFQEEKLLSTFQQFEKADWNGASWPPVLLHRDTWKAVGGFSEAFSPGMYSDPDLSMKLWKAGCRIFMGVSKSRVYHFQASSTGRVVKNNGRVQFMQKWGLPASAFYRYFLKMSTRYNGPLEEPTESLKLKLQRLKARIIGAFAAFLPEDTAK